MFYQKLMIRLRTAKLPSELLTQKNRVIKVRIGKPISVKDQLEYNDINSFYEYLRKKTYMLANPFVKNSTKYPFHSKFKNYNTSQKNNFSKKYSRFY